MNPNRTGPAARLRRHIMAIGGRVGATGGRSWRLGGDHRIRRRGDRAGPAGGQFQRQEGAASDRRRGRRVAGARRRSVQAGDIVVRLDDTQTRANLAIVTKALDEMAARQAREEAERDGADAVTFPAGACWPDERSRRCKGGQRRAQAIRDPPRRRAKASGRSCGSASPSSARRFAATRRRSSPKNKQIEWISKELQGVNELWEKNLVPYTRVTALEREKERLEGERGQLVAAIAQTKGKITETELQILQIDQDMRSEVGKDLAEIRAKTAELVEKKVAAEDQLKRVDIRAPMDGVVHQLAVHTVGGVIGPGEVIMLIVPKSDALDVEVEDAAAGHRPDSHRPAGRPAVHAPSISAPRRSSTARSAGFRPTSARIRRPARAITPCASRARKRNRAARDLKLVPGMPVEAFIQTSPRTVMSYLVKPFKTSHRAHFASDERSPPPRDVRKEPLPDIERCGVMRHSSVPYDAYPIAERPEVVA